MKLLLISVLFCLCSCETNRIIYYRYGGITITRIDSVAKSLFYYGSYNKNHLGNINPNIEVTYSGFNNGMDMFIVFHKNGTVEVIPNGIGDVEQTEKKDTVFYVSNHENHALDSILKSYLSSNLGYIRVSDALNIEDKFKREYHSRVQVIYSK